MLSVFTQYGVLRGIIVRTALWPAETPEDIQCGVFTMAVELHLNAVLQAYVSILKTTTF